MVASAPSAADIAARMGGVKSGDAWRVKGVCHDARQARSVIISDGARGPRVHCFAGCDYSHVLASLERATGLALRPSGGAVVPPAPRPRRRTDDDRAAWAARKAQQILTACEYGPHPYLERKGFASRRGLIDTEGRLVLPVRQVNGALTSIQTIAEDGEKRFLAGGVVRGGRLTIGRGPAWYCEGYATGLTLVEALRRIHRPASVVVCFSAANIPAVAGRSGIVVPDRDEAICQMCKARFDPPSYTDCPPCPTCGGPSLPPTGEKYARQTRLPLLVPPELGDVNDWVERDGYEPLIQAIRRM